MRLVRLALIAAIAVIVAACSGGAASQVPATGAPAPSAEASAAATRIEVTLSDDLKIEPATMTVPAGQPVTFVVTNTGTILHEFVLGDEEVQAEHEQEMIEDGGMAMPEDEENAIGVEAGQTKELTFTFAEPGTTLAGCHVIGHYAAGMKADITIE